MFGFERGGSVVEECATAIRRRGCCLSGCGCEGSTSSGSDCVLILPPAKTPKVATTSRRKPTSNARGRALMKERATDANNDEAAATDTTPTVPISKKVNMTSLFFANMKWVARMNSHNIILTCVQITNPNVVNAVCRQVRVPRMSVARVGAVLFLKVKTDVNIFLLNLCNAFLSIASNICWCCGMHSQNAGGGRSKCSNMTSIWQPIPN
jgi:hypothetical protein